MSSESLLKIYFVHLLLVSEELKRVCFKKVKVLIPGKWFFFLLAKSSWAVADCFGAGVTGWQPKDPLRKQEAELPPSASDSAFSTLFEFNG